MDKFTDILNSFNLQDELNSNIWGDSEDNEPKINEEIRKKLIAAANTFINFVGFDVFIEDITMTGSLANYNWSDYSDIDLHIIINFDTLGENTELFTEIFKLKRTLFNSSHNITVKDFDVELYIQDSVEEHLSTGVYSILYNEWINVPKKEEIIIDKKLIKDKVERWIDLIDNTINMINSGEIEFDEGMDALDGLKEKLKKYRYEGLERGGEFSYENLVFKFLRRNGYIQKLFDFKNDMMDRSLSLAE